jgi:hypothetical protein
VRKQPETLFKQKILPLLRALPNSFFIKIQMLAVLGIHDIIGCLNGKFIALELKRNRTEAARKTGRTKLQGYILLQIRGAGGYAEFVYPENWEKIHGELSEISEARAH